LGDTKGIWPVKEPCASVTKGYSEDPAYSRVVYGIMAWLNKTNVNVRERALRRVMGPATTCTFTASVYCMITCCTSCAGHGRLCFEFPCM